MAAKKSAKKKVASKKKASAKKGAAKKKAGAKKKAAAKKKGTAGKKKAGSKKASAPKKKAEKSSTSSMLVNLGHVFSLRPGVSKAFRQEDFRTARHLLQEEVFSTVQEAARAVAEKALELTHGTGGSPQSFKRDRQ